MIGKVIDLLENKRISELKAFLIEENPADIAVLLSQLAEKDEHNLPLVFRILPKELAADAFSHLEGDVQEILIASLNDMELKQVFNQLFLDDAVDLIEEMPANVVKRILKQTNTEKRDKINELLNYPEDSAGSIMTIEFVDLKKNMTVKQAFSHIRKTGISKETIYTCYVIDGNRKLLGLVSVKTLLLSKRTDQIKDIMETNLISVHTLDDQELVAKKFEKYDYLAIPVVDTENRLVGIITFDDAMDIVIEESTEDIEMMAAITPTDKSYMKESVMETYKKRIPWLMLLMISATFTGKIIQHYEDALSAYVILTAFIPMLMDTGGNAGGQSSTTIIRGLSLDEIHLKNIFNVISKEFSVALLCGITLSFTNFLKLLLIDQVSLSIALTVSVTLIITLIIAKTVGAMLPIAASRIGFDPAVMASPLITTIVDALSLIVYFNIATSVLGI